MFNARVSWSELCVLRMSSAILIHLFFQTGLPDDPNTMKNTMQNKTKQKQKQNKQN